MEKKFNVYVTTSNGFNGNVEVDIYYNGMTGFVAYAETDLGFIRISFDERDIYDISSIEEIKEYITNELEFNIERKLEWVKKELGVECKTLIEYEIAVFDMFNKDE